MTSDVHFVIQAPNLACMSIRSSFLQKVRGPQKNFKMAAKNPRWPPQKSVFSYLSSKPIIFHNLYLLHSMKYQSLSISKQLLSTDLFLQFCDRLICKLCPCLGLGISQMRKSSSMGDANLKTNSACFSLAVRFLMFSL